MKHFILTFAILLMASYAHADYKYLCEGTPQKSLMRATDDGTISVEIAGDDDLAYFLKNQSLPTPAVFGRGDFACDTDKNICTTAMIDGNRMYFQITNADKSQVYLSKIYFCQLLLKK